MGSQNSFSESQTYFILDNVPFVSLVQDALADEKLILDVYKVL